MITDNQTQTVRVTNMTTDREKISYCCEELNAITEARKQISARSAELDVREQNVLKQLEILRTKENELVFDDKGHNIRWEEGEIHLSKKAFIFIRTIAGKKSGGSIQEIERKVFDIDGTEERCFLMNRTLDTFLARFRKKLKKCNFPFDIVREKVKSKKISSLKITMFRLKRTKSENVYKKR
jgi:DNA-binding response OmpR family regulator